MFVWMRRFAALATLAIVFAMPLQAQTPEQIKAATDASIQKLRLQTELPEDTPHVQQHERKRWFESIDASGSGWGWTLFAVITLILLYAFRDQLLTLLSQRDPWKGATETNDTLTPEDAAKTSAAADDLARQGQFVEAMHLLLLRALTEMRQRLREHLADSLTSREILHHARLNESGHASLSDIINRVEWTYFGAHAAAHDDYTACRDSFNHFVSALQKERNS
jgi:hypothetical protein